MRTTVISSSQATRTSLWTLTLLLPIVRAQIGTITQEVNSIAAFAQQKVCAQSCFQYSVGNCVQDVLGSKIGCAVDAACGAKTWQAKNDCYCRSDLQQPGQDWLTSCVQSRCSVGDSMIDASSAGSIYGQYCLAKGYAPPPVPTVLPATVTKPGNTGPAATRGSGPGSIPSQTSSSSSQSGSSSSSNSLPITTIVGIAIGGLVGLIIIIFAIQKFVRNHRNKPPPYPPQYPTQNPIYVHEQPKQPNYAPYSQPSYPQPMYPQHQQWHPPPMPPHRTEEEVGPDDSVSMVGGMARPAPTLVSGTGPGFGRT